MTTDNEAAADRVRCPFILGDFLPRKFHYQTANQRLEDLAPYLRDALSVIAAHTAASAGEAVGWWCEAGVARAAGKGRFIRRDGFEEPCKHCTAVYAHPPAAVPADALERLVEKWRETADGWYGDDFNRGRQAVGMKCADELAALIPKGAV